MRLTHLKGIECGVRAKWPETRREKKDQRVVISIKVSLGRAVPLSSPTAEGWIW